MRFRKFLYTPCTYCILFLTVLTVYVNPLWAAHGISIDGKLKYPKGFQKFAYTSDNAVKGGHLVLHGLGSFDKMNPFTLKGNEPDGLPELVFETLAVPSLDEPFAEYGLVAKDIELAEDKMSVTFTINENARFSDGTPITVEDVKFSLEMLKSDKARPQYQFYFRDIENAEILDSKRIRFNFSQKNRELHMIAAQLPVLSKNYYTQYAFEKSSLETPVGSGPYIVADIKPGKSITYKRNPDYWGQNLSVRRNMYNFDKITYKYFKDQIISLEAFKAHDFDFMYINIAKQWARDLQGPKFNNKLILKETLKHKNNQGMQGFVMNIRKPLFQDPKVRKALSLAFDFEWANKALFFEQYTRSNSYFSNSELAATDLPKGLELDYLTPFKDKIPQEIFTKPLEPHSTISPNSLRKNLRLAKKLLTEAGWKIQNGLLTNTKGESFQFEILLYSPSFERVMEPYIKNLKKLGIKAQMRRVDAALYVRRIKEFDFDMMVNVFGQSQSPGNEQRDYWHSSSAARKGSGNLIGLQNEVVDALVEKIIYAGTQEELTAACKALDRILWYGYYVVPNWYIDHHRVVYWNIFNRPETLPLYYSPLQILTTWWMKETD